MQPFFLRIFLNKKNGFFFSPRSICQRRWTEGGFVLVTFYMLLVMVITLTGALVAHAVAEVQATQRSQASLQALYLAESGVDWAITQLRQNSTWAGGTGAASSGNYTVTLANLPANRRRITVLGTTNQGITASRSVESIVLVAANPLFRYAMFGATSAPLHGQGMTDSYNSSQGAYNPATAGSQGDIGTNGVTAGNISLHGNMTVKGNAYSGTGSNPNVVITMTDSDVIIGAKLPLSQPEPMTPVTVPSGTNLGNLSIASDNTVTLPGGTYIYDNISVSGRLQFTGPAKVYVNGTLTVVDNGKVSASMNLPPNLLFFGAGSGAVSIGGSDFYGGIYAPRSSISITDSISFYGSAIGNSVNTTGNISFHYDLALQNSGSAGPATVTVLSWQDLS